jgi:hypothetical protein
MANRFFNQFRKTLEKEQVSLFAKFSVGAVGAPTLDVANSKGIKSVVRNGVGLYTVTFGLASSSQFSTSIDTYKKLFMISKLFLKATAPAAPDMYLKANNVGAGSVQVQFNAAGVSTEIANGEVVLMEFDLGNSSAI